MNDAIAYTVEDAADAVGMSPRTIRRAVADGELVQHIVKGSMPRILRSDLEAWIAAAPTERASA